MRVEVGRARWESKQVTKTVGFWIWRHDEVHLETTGGFTIEWPGDYGEVLQWHSERTMTGEPYALVALDDGTFRNVYAHCLRRVLDKDSPST